MAEEHEDEGEDMAQGGLVVEGEGEEGEDGGAEGRELPAFGTREPWTDS